MRKLTVDEALSIAERIDHGHSDYMTNESRYAPLRKHHFLRESYIAMLQHPGSEFYRANFRVVCRLMEPDFLSILESIAFEDASLDDRGARDHIWIESRAV
jgi:hypothetical protein